MMQSRTPDCRVFNYADPALTFDGAKALQKQIVAYVRGL